MKTAIKIISLSLVLVMAAMMFVSCGDKSGSIKSAFEKEGYEVSVLKGSDDTAKTTLKALGMGDEDLEKIANYEIIICKDGLKSAVIIKYPSTDDLKSDVVGEDGDTEIYDEMVEEGYINGNCYIITLIPEALEIFKKA